jgi:hypothetical protein
LRQLLKAGIVTRFVTVLEDCVTRVTSGRWVGHNPGLELKEMKGIRIKVMQKFISTA